MCLKVSATVPRYGLRGRYWRGVPRSSGNASVCGLPSTSSTTWLAWTSARVTSELIACPTVWARAGPDDPARALRQPPPVVLLPAEAVP